MKFSRYYSTMALSVSLMAAGYAFSQNEPATALQADVGGLSLTVSGGAQNSRLVTLRVMGPDGNLVHDSSNSNGSISFNTQDLPDGTYRYEYRVLAITGANAPAESESDSVDQGFQYQLLERHSNEIIVEAGQLRVVEDPVAKLRKMREQQRDDLSYVDLLGNAALRVVESVLEVLIPTAHAADLTASSALPTLNFDDTAVAGIEWQQWGPSGAWYLVDVLTNSWPIFIEQYKYDGVHDFADFALAMNSIGDVLIARILGDVMIGNGGIYYDRSNSRVGIGSTLPEFDLHVFGNGGGSVEQVLRLESPVPPQMTFLNSRSSGTGLWYFAMTGDDQFKVSYDGTGKVEAKFFQNGNMAIAGTLAQNSDRDSKTGIVEVDNKTVLDAVLGMPVSTWEYKADKGVKHLGPMAQDFHAAFGLGTSPKSISSIDTGGVALAAIKGLNQVVQEKDKEIKSLKKGNQELSERLTRLEAQQERLSQLEAQQERLSQLEDLLRDLTVKGEVAQR